MIKPTVYIETTIPSIYYTARTGVESVARRDWTRKWWSIAPSEVNLVTSQITLIELSRGTMALTKLRIELLENIPLLPDVEDIAAIADIYLARKLMPRKSSADALHLAIASYHKCEFIATWNYKHLANANKYSHIRTVNTSLGLFVPTIVTPLELLGEHNDPIDD